MNFLEWFKKKGKKCEHYFAADEKSPSRRRCIFCGQKQVKKIDQWINV